MTDLHESFAAALSLDAVALHRAAERAAATGRPETGIVAALESLLADARSGGSESDEDTITDVLERFTEWSRPENRIRSAPLTNGYHGPEPVAIPATRP